MEKAKIKEFTKQIQFLCALYNIPDPTDQCQFKSLTPLKQIQHLNRSIRYMNITDKKRFHNHLDRTFINIFYNISHKSDDLIYLVVNETHPISILNQISQKEGSLAKFETSGNYVCGKFRGIELKEANTGGRYKETKTNLAKKILATFQHIKLEPNLKAYILQK